MNERDLKILEQYELCIDKTYRGRGSYLCESENNLYMLKECFVSEEKAGIIADVLEFLNDNGFNVDCYVKNKEEKYVTKDREGVGFLVKQWSQAKESDTKNIAEICLVASEMGKMHEALRRMEKADFISEPVSCSECFEKRMRELRKIKNYINKKKSRTQFEICYMKQFDDFFELAQKAKAEAEKINLNENFICHGDFNHHNALVNDSKVYIVNFDKCHYSSQIEDLYLYMRKILEKNDWDVSVGKKIFDSYNSMRKISGEEKRELYARFVFPEKFWKISNHYYNARKVWGIERNQYKLDRLNEQAAKKQNFVQSMKGW